MPFDHRKILYGTRRARGSQTRRRHTDEALSEFRLDVLRVS
ncbi:hypothetical protein GQ600_27319 [Phytophthora cactorum]|nr:hypothetical protein GQ600_27319 [Phytophthora cactorum]